MNLENLRIKQCSLVQEKKICVLIVTNFIQKKIYNCFQGYIVGKLGLQ
jgi:hypothetical protein